MATIQGVYVALFGRPADPTGLAYFNAATNNGANLTAIGDLASTAEYKERFKDKDNNQIVTAIYQSLFNRDPDADGLNFFVNALNTGSLNINNIAIAILDGAQGSDKTIVDAKIASANAFTTALDTPVEVAAYAGKAGIDAGVAFLTGITTTAKTAADADADVKTLVESGNAGNAVAVAIGIEVAVGAAGSTVASSDKNDTITFNTILAASTDAQKVNGGFGFDTVVIKTDATGAAATYAPAAADFELTSVEKLVLTAKGDLANSGAITLDLGKSTSVKEVWNADSAGGTVAATASAVTLTNVALGTTIGFKGGVTGATSVSFKDVDGSSDAVTVAFDGATVTGATSFAGIEVLNISSTGASSVTNLFGAKEIKISGSGEFTNIAVAAGDTTTVTNSSTASVTIDLSVAEKVATYTGSAAVDIVTTNVAGLLANQTINTGAGNDIINVGAGSADFTLTLTGGAGNDTFNFSAALSNVVAGTAGDFAKALVTITDFNAAQDVIKLVVNGTKATLNNADIGNIAAAADLHAAVGVVEAAITGVGYAVFSFKGDTYVFQDDNVGGLGTADGLLKIAGLADASALTNANFIVA